MKNLSIIFWMVVISLFSQNCASLLPHTEIPPGYVGLLFEPREGGLKNKIYENGTVWHSFYGRMILYTTQLVSYSETVEVTTQDELTINVASSVRMRPFPDQIFDLHTKIGPKYYETIVREDFRASIRNVLSNYPLTQINKKNTEIEIQIKNVLLERIKGKYLDIDDVNIDKVSYADKIRVEIEEKEAKKREVEKLKNEYSVQQAQEEIEKMKAKRDAEVKVIEAEARSKILVANTKAQEEVRILQAESKLKEAESNAKAMMINAKAQADAQKLLNQSLTKEYLQLKALESPNAKYIYYPAGSDKLPTVNVQQNEYRYLYGGKTLEGKSEKSNIKKNDKMVVPQRDKEKEEDE